MPSLPGAPLCCGQTGGSDQLRPPLPREPSVPALPTPPPPGTPKSNAGIDSSLGDAGSRSHARVASGVARRTGCWSLVCRSNLCLYCVSRNYQLFAGPGSFLARTLSPNPASWGEPAPRVTVPLGSAQEQRWEVNRAPGPLPSRLWVSVPQQGRAGGPGPWSGPQSGGGGEGAGPRLEPPAGTGEGVPEMSPSGSHQPGLSCHGPAAPTTRPPHQLSSGTAREAGGGWSWPLHTWLCDFVNTGSRGQGTAEKPFVGSVLEAATGKGTQC